MNYDEMAAWYYGDPPLFNHRSYQNPELQICRICRVYPRIGKEAKYLEPFEVSTRTVCVFCYRKMTVTLKSLFG